MMNQLESPQSKSFAHVVTAIKALLLRLDSRGYYLSAQAAQHQPFEITVSQALDIALPYKV
jgi:hypothetical protein